MKLLKIYNLRVEKIFYLIIIKKFENSILLFMRIREQKHYIYFLMHFKIYLFFSFLLLKIK